MVFERNAQGVGIFGEDDRTVATLEEVGYVRHRGIVWSIYVSDLGEVIVEAAEITAHLGIADWTDGVEFPFHIISELDADVGQGIFVAQTPDEHRSVVLVASNGGLGTLLEDGVEGGV